MDIATVSILCVAGLLVFMMLGVPIAYSLGFCAVMAGLLCFGSACLGKVGWIPFYLLYNLSWTPLPLFVLLGSIIAETKIGADLFKAARNWLGRIPGGLIISGIMGEAALAATVGVSSACTIVVGKVALPEFERHGYKRSLGLGGLLVGGALGPLIPPSAPFIIISVLAELSLGRLFMAGVVPGILLAIMLSLATILVCWLRPEFGPPGEKFSWREKFVSISKIWPVVIVILSILGSIYLGVATPTEAAGIGCVVVLLLSITLFGLRLDGIRRAITEAALINAMILFIMIGASFFTYFVGSANVAKHLFSVIESSEISPWLVIFGINVILLLLGCIIDPMTITFLAIPILFPLITSLGFDPLWFAVVFVVNVQIGLITPPMGIDLFAVKTIFDIPIGEIIRGVTPFLLVVLIFLGIIIAFPELSLWLPSRMVGQ
jgi:C4-dicarboxylate transporter DctM subunit